MLPILHGKPSEDPYGHVDELSQVCEINHLQNVPADTMKMKLFPVTLRDRTKDWVLKYGKNSLVGQRWRKNSIETTIPWGKQPQSEKPSASLPKARVKPSTRPGSD